MILLDVKKKIENKYECIKLYSIQARLMIIALSQKFSYWKLALSKLQKKIIKNAQKWKKSERKEKIRSRNTVVWDLFKGN